MRLLEALDFYKQSQSGAIGEYVGGPVPIEFEYRLYSWGEIYPNFIGDREHSIAARRILNKFPFKLFSSSTPYSTLPQKLCLTFKAPYVVNNDSKSSPIIGVYPDEIAKEFAAFLSLVTRRRVFVSAQIRCDGLPIEEKINLYPRSHFQEMQRLKEIDPEEIYQLLENLRAMDRRIGNGFIIATRLYHSAIEMMYTEPEFSYLFLVMSLETISSIVYKKEDVMPSDVGDERSDLEIFLDSKYPRWHKFCDISTSSRRQVIDMLLTKEYFNFRKFWKFAIENLPEHFWSETEDDAKPCYLTQIIKCQGGEQFSSSDITITNREKIENQQV